MRRGNRQRLTAFAIGIAVLGGARVACAQSAGIEFLFAENFEDVPLIDSPTFGFPDAWSPEPPPGWDVGSEVQPQDGTPEFSGWTLWREDLWREIGQRERDFFNNGDGVIAIADVDLWNDPIDRNGEPLVYQTLLQSPFIDLAGQLPNEKRLVLAFDTAWRPGCCGDGGDPEFPTNQAAIVRVLVEGQTQPIEVLRWESAQFFDQQGRPTNEPIDPAGNQNRRNPRFQPVIPNDRFHIDLQDLFDQPRLAFKGSSPGPLGGSAPPGLSIEFAIEGAGDDGFWAVDNVEIASIEEEIDGDMFIDGILDERDVAEFALALLDEEEYLDRWFDEAPVDRGSADSYFDYDDIPWFLSLFGDSEPAAAAMLHAALAGVPEPGAAALALLTVGPALLRGRTG